MKPVVRDLIVVLFSVLLSMFLNIGVDDFFMGTIYTVSGIMFSIGISILVTFNLHGIKKQSLIDRIRKSLNKARNIFIYYFSVSTVLFVLERYLRESKIHEVLVYKNNDFSIIINVSFAIAFLIFYCIFYFILNFLEVQKLNDEIFDDTMV